MRIRRTCMGWIIGGGLAAGLALSGCPEHARTYSDLSAETLENVAHVLWMQEFDPDAIPDDIAGQLLSDKNTESAFGQRMRCRLTDLLAHPDSFTPDYSSLYNTFMDHATSLTPHQAYALTTVLGLDSSRGYQELPTDITFAFPDDDRPQWNYQVGWHFFVGSAFSESGAEYGVELMFWQYCLLPPDLAEDVGLSDIENQLVEIHFAVTPVGGRHYRAKPSVVAGTTGLIRFSAAPFNYEVGNNVIRSLTPASLFPLQLKAWGLDNTQDEQVEIAIDLTLEQTKDYILEGDRGLAPSCGGVGTLYYSVPNLVIDPSASGLRINGEETTLASGKFWYDHQWGTGFMPSGNPRSEVLRAVGNLTTKNPGGWDWMMIQFDDNTEITLSALHTAALAGFYQQTGTNPPGAMTAVANGLFIDAAGVYVPVSGHIEVTEWIRSTVSHGQYMTTNTWYPNRVEVTVDTETVPENGRHFVMVPIVQTGQQGFFANGAQYSEGAVFIETADGDRIGRGFLESTGYTDMRNQVLRLGGLPETEDMLQLISAQPVPAELQEESGTFLADPVNAALLATDIANCHGL